MEQPPTVYLVVADSAMAFATNGEIVETVDWTEDGKPDWESAGICDFRGGGGEPGFMQLAAALRAGERNAVMLGFKPVHVDL